MVLVDFLGGQEAELHAGRFDECRCGTWLAMGGEGGGSEKFTVVFFVTGWLSGKMDFSELAGGTAGNVAGGGV